MVFLLPFMGEEGLELGKAKNVNGFELFISTYWSSIILMGCDVTQTVICSSFTAEAPVQSPFNAAGVLV